ncbi:DUF551 domain-containing protein [Enterobacter kobei]|uniref:DUF551 domain-containing protein n=1 Tax=Enterobacter kobei TaxID=208224 RepID=UPI002002D297|nr:DUF551 domain-containing protein [Enterobacter kobei]MCK7006386.1 DUF551 domain-containing protein [Enterobacter kobei]
MSTITKEFTKEQLIQKLKHRISVASGFPDSEKAKMDLELARIALESLEAEPVAWLLSGGGAKNHVSFDSGNAYADPLREVTPLYTATPAPVSVPYLLEQFAEFMAAESIKSGDYPDGWQCKASNAAHEYAQNIRAAMLQGSGPLTIKANGGGSEKDEPPKRGWVVTHSGKDYFYREQGDAATHMNAAVESGRKVSLRSFIPETVTAAYKSPDSWMACRDQNPEKGRHLALFGKRTKENCDPYVDEGYLGSDGEFYFFDWEGGPRINDCHPYDKAEVTHWMYRDLPAAPQQEVESQIRKGKTVAMEEWELGARLTKHRFKP